VGKRPPENEINVRKQDFQVLSINDRTIEEIVGRIHTSEYTKTTFK
jgi:hypothetical protein